MTQDSQIRYLRPDGETGVATGINLTSDQLALFSVSPDDTRIAVTVFSYGPGLNGYLGMRMYVEDVQGATKHVDLFSSTSTVEYPIGWVAGRLIVAVTNPPAGNGPHGPASNPYGASAYHVVDPTNGDRLASLCDNSLGPVGLIEPFGTMCTQAGGAASFWRWDGSPFPAPAVTINSQVSWQAAPSPDGSQVALAGNPGWIVGAHNRALSIPVQNTFGWLDESRFVYQKPGANVLSVFDLQTETSFDIGQPQGTYLGAFPVGVT